MNKSHDFPFGIQDVAELLHLRMRRPHATGGYYDCPICGDKRGKMSISSYGFFNIGIYYKNILRHSGR